MALLFSSSSKIDEPNQWSDLSIEADVRIPIVFHSSGCIEIKNDLKHKFCDLEEKEWTTNSNNISRTDFFSHIDQLEKQFPNKKHLHYTKGDKNCPILLDSIITNSSYPSDQVGLRFA